MGDLATLLSLLGVAAFGVAVFTFFKPLPKLRLATRKASGVLAALSVGSCVAGGALMPAPPAPAPAAAPAAEPAEVRPPPTVISISPEERALAAAEIAADEAARDAKIPANVPAAPVRSHCMQGGDDEKICEANILEFEKKDWPRAWGGDYQGQRNVAYCLAEGCMDAVPINKVLACAWRQVIQMSGDIQVGQGDLKNLEIHCFSLDGDSRAAARAQAESIFRTIYKRPMPTPDDW